MEELMNEQPNVSMLPQEPSSMVQTWMNAITKPNEQTYAQIAASPNAKASTAFLWIFIASLVQSFVTLIIQGVVMSQMMQGTDFEVPALAPGLASVLCGAPILAVLSVVFFAVFAGIVQWLAGLFGGQGSFDKLAYVLAAITVPFTFISAILTLLSAIPFAGWCFGILSLFLVFYVIFLEITAVKGVNRFGWGQAAGSVLLPFFALFCCILAGIFGLASMLGPQLQDILDQISPTFTP